MKKFKFKLEPLLRLRRLREDQQKAALGQVAGQMRQLQGRLEDSGAAHIARAQVYYWA